MRILLADGDEVFLEIVQSFLWDRGHEAEIAADGLECISILRAFLPDALVIDRDILWGGTDAVLELMAENVDLSKVPIILKVDGRLGDQRLAHLSLPVACLAKPYRLGELLGHLNEASCANQSRRVPVEST